MTLTSLSTENFRNLTDSQISFDRGVNILTGCNAAGKTSVLEAIYLFARSHSFRTSHDREMIKQGADYLRILSEFENSDGETVKMSYACSQNGKRVCTVNDIRAARLSEFIGIFRAVIFAPEHLAIVKEGPSVRRGLVDAALSQLDSGFVRVFQDFSRVLSQRNACLKNLLFSGKEPDETLSVLSEQFARLAAEVGKKRRIYTEKLSAHATLFLSDMTSGSEALELVYDRERTEEEYLGILTDSENNRREIKNGATLWGPHRDDITILHNGREARPYCSQGQQRSIALAIKLAEGELSRETTGEYPVFLLDDVLSELDAGRRGYILSGIGDRQVFITACDAEAIKNLSSARHFEVCNGVVENKSE